MDYIREKDSKTDWSESVKQSYEDEEKIRKQHTHIFIKKESEFSQVDRVIKKYQEYSTMEFDTIFKLYKTQNYTLTTNLFEGSSYKYGTLSAFLHFVRVATKGNIGYSSNATFQLISSFVKEIKEYSQPFPQIFPARCKVDKLIASKTLTQEELDMLTKKISSSNPCSEEERTKPNSKLSKNTQKTKGITTVKRSTKEKRRTSRWATTPAQKLSAYKLIVKNYKKGHKFVKKLVPELNDKTVENYVRICRHLENKERIPKSTPISLVDTWHELCDVTEQLSVDSLLNKSEPIINHETTSSEYILFDNNEVLKTSGSLEFLKGFREAMLERSNEDLKIYKLIEV